MRSISPGTLILGIFAILFGLAGAYAVKKHLEARAPEVAKPTEATWSVPLAVTDLPAGRALAKGDVMVVQATKAQLLAMELPSSYMSNASEVIGRRLRQAVTKGKAFDPDTFYPVGLGPSVADRLKPGQRAVTIPFKGTAADAGLITPGAVVDVLFRSHADEQAKLPEATVALLEHITVLAVGNESFEGALHGDNQAKTVTLAVAPQQAHALKVVEDRGSITLVLRSAEDDLTTAAAAPTTLSELLGIEAPKKPFATEIYRRGQLATVVHGDQQETVGTRSGPYTMPVVGQPRSASAQVVLTSGRMPTPAADAETPAKAPCPCSAPQIATVEPGA